MEGIANPVAPSGALVYVDWWAWLGNMGKDAGLAGLVSASLTLILWAIIVKVKPQYAPQIVAKAIVGGFIAPVIVVLLSYGVRLLGHQDYFTLERFLAVMDVYFKVSWATGVFGVIASSLGIDLDKIIDFIKAAFQQAEVEKQQLRAVQSGGEDKGGTG